MFFDITKTLTLGLAGLGLVSALPAQDTASVAQRDNRFALDSRGLGDKVKLSEIADNLSGDLAQGVDPTKDRAKGIFSGKWFVKTTGNFENEIKVYNSIDGKGISAGFLAQIVAEDSDSVIGFAIQNVDGSEPPDEDKPIAVDLVTKLHDAGWAHTDAHKKNFIKAADGTIIMVDFEAAEEADDDNIEEDFQRLDEEFGIPDDDDDEPDWD